MEELSERGSRRPLGGADEREGKVAAEGVVQEKVATGGVVQKRWLLQRSLEVTTL